MSEEPVELLESMFVQIARTLEEMAKTKDLQQRQIHSEIVRNLCQSIDVFFGMMHDLPVPDDELDDYLDDDEE